MNAKLFKNIIASIPDDAEIWVEKVPEGQWVPLKSIRITKEEDTDASACIYLNFSD